jgi:TPR repeat protein
VSALSVSAAARIGPGRVAGWLALLLGVCAYGLAGFGYRNVPRAHPLEELAYYPSGAHLGQATLGHPESAADLAWLRAVQYYGEHRTTDLRFEHMFHVFDILTSLSPHFISAYVFGAFALEQEGRDFARAEQLMLKGLEANPTSGRLAFEAGFLYYVKPGGRDLARAAEYFEQAARQSDAPPQAARFAAFARQNSGDLAMAWALWARVRETSGNSYMRDLAERKMAEIRKAIADGRHEEAMIRLTTPRVVIQESKP